MMPDPLLYTLALAFAKRRIWNDTDWPLSPFPGPLSVLWDLWCRHPLREGDPPFYGRSTEIRLQQRILWYVHWGAGLKAETPEQLAHYHEPCKTLDVRPIQKLKLDEYNSLALCANPHHNTLARLASTDIWNSDVEFLSLLRVPVNFNLPLCRTAREIREVAVTVYPFLCSDRAQEILSPWEPFLNPHTWSRSYGNWI